MTEGQAVETPKKRKGLLAFYIATGLLALLFVGFCFAWTPLRVWYWEREVRRVPSEVGDAGLGWFVGESQRRRAARKLADLGSPALGAFERLLASPDTEFKLEVLASLGKPEDGWAVPLLLGVVQKKPPSTACAAARALNSIWQRSAPSFDALQIYPFGSTEQQAFLAWWNREGKAKYGRGVE